MAKPPAKGTRRMDAKAGEPEPTLQQLLRIGNSRRVQAEERERMFTTIFTFAHSEMLARALGDTEEDNCGRDLLTALVCNIIDSIGIEKLLDAMVLQAFARSCADMPEVDQNSWRRVGDAILQARSAARANHV